LRLRDSLLLFEVVFETDGITPWGVSKALGEQAREGAHEAGVEKVIAARGLRETLSRNGYCFDQNDDSPTC
jgi:hypothetical protein